jgi:hypothetical protein
MGQTLHRRILEANMDRPVFVRWLLIALHEPGRGVVKAAANAYMMVVK